jgi:hypothetical protein
MQSKDTEDELIAAALKRFDVVPPRSRVRIEVRLATACHYDKLLLPPHPTMPAPVLGGFAAREVMS